MISLLPQLPFAVYCRLLRSKWNFSWQNHLTVLACQGLIIVLWLMIMYLFWGRAVRGGICVWLGWIKKLVFLDAVQVIYFKSMLIQFISIRNTQKNFDYMVQCLSKALLKNNLWQAKITASSFLPFFPDSDLSSIILISLYVIVAFIQTTFKCLFIHCPAVSSWPPACES